MSGGERALRIEALRRVRPRDRFVRASLIGLASLMIGAWILGDFEWSDLLSERRQQNLSRFLTELVPFPLRGEPWSWTQALAWAGDLWRGEGSAAARATVAISLLAILLAGAAGLVLALPAARNLASPEPFVPGAAPASALQRAVWRTLSLTTRLLLSLLRAVPEYVWAFLLLAVFGPSAWPAVLALAIHNAGILGRLGAETIENSERGAAAALRGIGASRLQLSAVALAPSLLPRLLLYFFYRWETCVREATVLGMLGITSLGLLIDEARVRGHYDSLLLMVGIGAAIVIAGDVVSTAARALVRRAS